MDPKSEIEHCRLESSNEGEVRASQPLATIHSWGECAEDAKLGVETMRGGVSLRERDEGLRCALRVADKSELSKSCLCKNTRGEGREIESSHVPNVPGPEAGITLLQVRVVRIEATAIVP